MCSENDAGSLDRYNDQRSSMVKARRKTSAITASENTSYATSAMLLCQGKMSIEQTVTMGSTSGKGKRETSNSLDLQYCEWSKL